VLVVHQWMSPGSPQDQQRGSIYAPAFAKAGVPVRFIGRRPYPLVVRWRGPFAPAGRIIRRSLVHRAWRRLVDPLVIAINDAHIAGIAPGYDRILLVKVDSPALVRRLRSRAPAARIVYDLADVEPDVTSAADPVEQTLPAVDAVTVDNSVTAAFAAARHATVFPWPPLAYVERFDEIRAASRRGRDGQVVLGWVGSETTASNLAPIVASLARICAAHPNVRVRLLGVSPDHPILAALDPSRLWTLPIYDASEMVHAVNDMDVGLFPLPASASAAVHGVTKGLIYMGGGAAVVASPVGDCTTLIQPGVNGMLAATAAEWQPILERLVVDADLRGRLAAAGLRTVRGENTIERCYEQLSRALAL
jgi:glycosyltransferase involved in cell wall biosynthesis